MNVLIAKSEPRDFSIDGVTGAAYISYRKLAEILETTPSSLQRLVNKLPDTLKGDTNQGLNEIIVKKAIQHYAYKNGKNSNIARALLDSVIEAGIRAYLYHQAGYTVSAAPAEKPSVRAELEEKDRLYFI